jgi:hypothetical protein
MMQIMWGAVSPSARFPVTVYEAGAGERQWDRS